MKGRTITVITLVVALAQAAYAESGNMRQRLNAVVLVADRFEAADDLERWVQRNGGYPVSRLEDRLILRVPSASLEEFVSLLETVADEVIQIEQDSEEISQSLLEVEAGIRSKSELFQNALTLIDQTDLSTTLEIEGEVLSILADLEGLRGQHRKLLDEVALARVQVDFTLHEERLPENLPSSFPWINLVDFYLLMGEFERN